MKGFNLEKYLLRYKGFKKDKYDNLILEADWDECNGQVYNAFRNKGFNVTYRDYRGSDIFRVFVRGYELFVNGYTYDINTNLYTITCSI